jgi:hypothetical protein
MADDGHKIFLDFWRERAEMQLRQTATAEFYCHSVAIDSRTNSFAS